MSQQLDRTLVGRDAELAVLLDQLELREAAALGRAPGPPRVVMLAGDAGVGKTRLLTETRDRAVDQGWQVVAGQCVDFGESALPYLPFSEVLARLAESDSAVVTEVLERHPALMRLQPGSRTLADNAEHDARAFDRGDTFAAVQHLLEYAAARQPLLLVIEDVHWADRSTCDLLGYLFTRTFAAPVSIVASYRLDDLHRRHPLRRDVAQWLRLGTVERLLLAPLPEAAVRQLVARLAATPFAESDVAGIVARAEGNAFFVEELIASGSGLELSEELADLLLVRLDALDEAAREVVRVASVAGRTVSHDLLARASWQDPQEFDDAIRSAVEMNVLLARSGSYSFRHALLGEAIYDDLLPGERVRLHAAYAEALTGGSARGTAAELALHARRANDLATALTASIDAGHEAMTVGGPAEAAQHFEAALALLPHQPVAENAHSIDVSRLATSAADALAASGSPQRAVAVLKEQLDRHRDDAPNWWRARMLATYGRLLCIVDSDVDAVEVVDEAARLAPEGDSGLRARVLASQARVLAKFEHFERAQEVGLEALTLAERLDLPLLATEVITTLSGMRRAGPKDELRVALQEAAATALASGAELEEVRAYFLLGRSHEDGAEWEDATTWFTQAIERCAGRGLDWAPFVLESRWHLAQVQVARGNLDEAIAVLGIADGPGAPSIPSDMLRAVRVSIDVARGHEVRTQLAALRTHWGQEGGIAIHSGGAELQAAADVGAAQEAIVIYDDVVGLLSRVWHEWFGARIRFATLTIAAVCRAAVSATTEQRTRLLEQADRLHADAAQVLVAYNDPAGSWGPEGRYWAKRADAETLRARWLAGIDAPPREVLVDTWAETEQLADEYGHVIELARVRVIRAGIMRALGDVAEARRLIKDAQQTAQRLELQPLLDDLRALGAAAGRRASARQPAPHGGLAAAGLTPREAEILEHVSAGRSNGEIGKLLFISTKTVSVHVSNILAKLGASGRTEAAAIARRAGLLKGD